MITRKFKIRVMYPDIDQMGYVHHSNYVKYYETARWELLRNIGIPYKMVEDAGYLLPVTDMTFKFIKPAFYDELLIIETNLKAIKGARIWFTYKTFNTNGELINHAETVLAFVTKTNRKPCHPPDFVLKAIKVIMQKEQVYS
jgi:acyl-CoA thioester hydrolase